MVACAVCNAVLSKAMGETVLKTTDQGPVQILSSELQIGTEGSYQGQSFIITGRLFTWFHEAVYNYWTLLMADGNVCLLSEGYGHYSILQPHTGDLNFKETDAKSQTPGSLARLIIGKEETWILLKKQPVIRWEVAGEAWVPVPSRYFTVFDYAGSTGTAITVFYAEKAPVLSFANKVLTPTELQLKYTSTEKLKEKKFNCTDCKHEITVKAYPYSQSCGCQNCGTQYFLKEASGFVKKQASRSDELPDIPLGSTGMLNDIEYEVIGYVQKEENSVYHSKWREYTLFNPDNGFAFLSEYDGHWIFLKERQDCPVVLNTNELELLYEGHVYEPFNKYKYSVTNARGEFPYNLFNNQNTTVIEYISPPTMWIKERDNKEGIRWFFGHHFSHNELARIFPVANLPYRTGVGALQPAGKLPIPKLAIATSIGVILLAFFHFLISSNKMQLELINARYDFSDTSHVTTAVTDKFELIKKKSNIRLDIDAAVSNSWFELAATLVNAKTGKEYSLEQGVEYYYGYSDGERWSEGKSSQTTYFNRIPAGTYFLQLQGTRDPSMENRISNFYVQAVYDVPVNRNFWITLLLFLVVPIGSYARTRYRESARWSNSPFKPEDDD
jgi:hypothetical protein